MDKQIFDDNFVKFEIKENYLKAVYKNNIHITLPIAKQIVAKRMAFMQEKKFKAMVIIPEKINMDKLARDYLSSPEGLHNIMATAIVVHSKYSYFLASFFIKIIPQQTPVKIFTIEEKAIAWLTKI